MRIIGVRGVVVASAVVLFLLLVAIVVETVVVLVPVFVTFKLLLLGVVVWIVFTSVNEVIGVLVVVFLLVEVWFLSIFTKN